jgi:hypothetical protein
MEILTAPISYVCNHKTHSVLFMKPNKHLNIVRQEIQWKDGALVATGPDDEARFWKSKKTWWLPQGEEEAKSALSDWWADKGGDDDGDGAKTESTWSYYPSHRVLR